MPYRPEDIAPLRQDMTQALGGQQANPWLLALMAMRQAQGNPNWSPGAQNPEYSELVSDLQDWQPGMKSFPSAIRREEASRQERSQQMDALMRALENVVPPGGQPSGGGVGAPGQGQVSGFSPGAISTGLSALGAVPGATPNPFGMVSNALSVADFLGLMPTTESLTQSTPAGQQDVMSVNMPTGILSALNGLLASLGIGDESDAPGIANVAAVAQSHGLMGNTMGITDAEIAAAIAENTTSPSPTNAGWVDTDQLTMNVDPVTGEPTAPNAPPNTDTNPGLDPGPVGPPGVGAPGTGPGGTGGTGTGGPGGPGAPGPDGTGQAKRGGITKGRPGKQSPTKVHGQEYVVNHRATQAFKPMLEAMNQIVPYKDKYAKESIDSLFARAKKLLDGEA